MNDTLVTEPAARTGNSLFRIAASHAGGGLPIAGGDVARWILGAADRGESDVKFLDELCWRLVGQGVPLARATLHFGTLHPLISGLAVRWSRPRALTEEIHIAHGADGTDEYLRSPIRSTIERGEPFRRRLDRDHPEFPLLGEIRAAGGTEYLAMPLNPFLERWPVVTWTTDRTGGFTEAHVGALLDVVPALAAIVDSRAVRRVSANLLGTYLGPEASRRVLAGQVRRGEGVSLNAVIMATDLRGFTALSDRLDASEMIALLDDYFDAIASPIHERQGEVLKFIGDGVLAIFPVTGAPAEACTAALRAVAAARAGMAHLDAVRQAQGLPPLPFGAALHLGEMLWGNIGAVDRLDFTAIGPAVNLVSRLEGLCRPLGRWVLISGTVAAETTMALMPLGEHVLRGIAAPCTVFTLPDA